MSQYKEKIKFDGLALKIIAVVTMLIDHVGMVFFSDYVIFRIIGRIAFPIFCFLLVEGFLHTSSVKKYALGLLVFGIISEIPFDLMASGGLVYIYHQNVFFTLLIGLLTIYMIDITENNIAKIMWLIAGVVFSVCIVSDYSFYGITLIYIFYCFKDKRPVACITMMAMSMMIGTVQMAAALAVIPIMLYNGERGPKFMNKKIVKYGFYAFYPIHMLIISFIYMCING